MIETKASLRRPLAAAIVAAAVLAACRSTPPAPGDLQPSPPSGLPRGELVVDMGEGEVRIDVEIAETPETKAQGLMGRQSLPPDTGMVFLEDEPVETGFWMKDTLIPLSIAFWGPDRRIRRILDMEPCQEDPCPVYDPGVAWVGAVEVNQGFFERTGVQVGDRVRLERR